MYVKLMVIFMCSKSIKLLKEHKRIKDWLDTYQIKNYTIREDLSVDVDGMVDLQYKGIKEIPIQFGKIIGTFICSHNYITSTDGFPREVEQDFYARYMIGINQFRGGTGKSFTKDEILKVCKVRESYIFVNNYPYK